MKITNDSSHQAFKSKPVPKFVRKTIASKIIAQIKPQIPEGAKMVKEKDAFVLRAKNGKVLIRKEITALDSDPLEPQATKGVLKTVFKTEKGEQIKEIKNYYNDNGVYKVEISDADGLTIRTNESDSFYEYPPSLKNKINLVVQNKIDKLNSFVSTFFNEKGNMAEKQYFAGEAANLTEKLERLSVERAKYADSGDLFSVQKLAPSSRKILSESLQGNERNRLTFVDNSRSWIKYS